MASYETERVNFAAAFVGSELDVTVLQLDQGRESVLRIRVVNRASYGSDLYTWWRGGWGPKGRIEPVWTSHLDPWASCEYWGPIQEPAPLVEKFCGSCGAPRVPGGRFCGECGAPFTRDGSGTSVRSEVERAIAQPAQAGAILTRLIDTYSLSEMKEKHRRILREKLGSVLTTLSPKQFIDGMAPSAATDLTLAAAQEVGWKVGSGQPLSSSDRATAAMLLTKAPLEFGYWGPFKSLLKNLNPALMPREFGMGLGRLVKAEGSPPGSSGSTVPGCEDLSVLSRVFRLPLAGTLLYMQRRMRRLLAALSDTDPNTYAVVASSMVIAWDSPLAPASYLPSYVLLGGTPHLTRRSRDVEIPVQQRGRRDAHPEIWDSNIDLVLGIIGSIRSSGEAFTFAIQVVRDSGRPLPSLTNDTVPLALSSTDPTVVQLGQSALAGTPQCWDRLSDSTWESFFLSADLTYVEATVAALQAHVRIDTVAWVAKEILDRERSSDEARMAAIALVYLAYSAPADSGSRQWPTSDKADANAVTMLGVVYGFDRTPESWRKALSGLPSGALLDAFLALAADARVSAGTIDLVAEQIARPASDSSLLGLAFRCLGSSDPRVSELGWRLVTLCQDRSGAFGAIFEGLRIGDLSTERRIRILQRLMALADSDQVNDLLTRILTEQGWGFDRSQQALLVGSSFEGARVLWSALAAADATTALELVTNDPALLKAVGNRATAADFGGLTENQQRTLLAYVLSNPDRIRSEPEFGARLACTPNPDLQRAAIDQLTRSAALTGCWLMLAESALPLPLAAVRTHIESVRNRYSLTEIVLAAIDSHVGVVRDMGLQLLDTRREDLDADAIWSALTESDDIRVQARVAEEALARPWADDAPLAGFDRRVLVTRRVNRRGKEHVKARLENATTSDLTALLMPERMEALQDMAAGTNARDREWALQRLALLALRGVQIDGVRVSQTNTGSPDGRL